MNLICNAVVAVEARVFDGLLQELSVIGTVRVVAVEAFAVFDG